MAGHIFGVEFMSGLLCYLVGMAAPPTPYPMFLDTPYPLYQGTLPPLKYFWGFRFRAWRGRNRPISSYGAFLPFLCHMTAKRIENAL